MGAERIMTAASYLSFFRRLDNQSSVLAAIEVLFDALDAGHVCLSLSTLAQRLVVDQATLLSHLIASPLVGNAGDFRPFIIDNQRLYLAKLWFEELRIVKSLQQKMQTLAVDTKKVKSTLNALFEDSPLNPDWQKVAVLIATLQRLTVISGGPGTGKTTTLAKLLIMLLALEDKPQVIKLAAPTGKAAARMQAAINAAKSRLSAFSSFLEFIPGEATTLHRLFKMNPLQSRETITPIHVDILVIDEASMIDLSMMSVILRSISADTRLILLGDQEQLSSIEPGSVFADISQAVGFSKSMLEKIKEITDFTLAPTSCTSLLSDAVVHLQHSYRFAANSGIGALASAVKTGDQEATFAVLDKNNVDVEWIKEKSNAHAQMIAGYQPYFEKVRNLSIPMQEVFTVWEQFQILTPLREGSEGSIALNAKISRAYAKEAWYTGRAIMINANHPQLGLSNGDIGITRVIDGQAYVYFLDEAKSQVRRFTPNRLPAFESAFVMTVHKSQGSEFDHVYCYLPEILASIMNRALLYTAVTRAKQKVSICGEASIIEEMLNQCESRESGLWDKITISS